MSEVTVVYDACVLYPALLRDLLMYLAITDLYRAKWTNEIHEEWIVNVLHKRPDLTRKQLDRTKKLMNENIRDCLMQGYQHLVSALELQDKNDRHVLAAAIKASASTIVTFNLKDFPFKYLEKYNIEAQHPDKFISRWFEVDPGVICGSVKKLGTSLKNPSKTASQYINMNKWGQV